jgi:peptide/nickel transport system permease protein
MTADPVPGSSAARGRRWRRRLAGAGRTLATVAVTLIGLLALTFFIGRVMPVDPVTAIVGEQADQITYDKVYKELGLDRPLPVQFGIYVRDLLHGDFGTAIATGHPVIEDIGRVFPATMELATLGLIGGMLLGVPMGIVAAVHRNGAADHAVRFFGLVFHSVPNFWLGLMALVVFYAGLGWIGGTGRVSLHFVGVVPEVTGSILIDALLARDWDVALDAFRHAIAPAAILATGAMAYLSRMTRSFMLDQLNQEYVTAARIKGLSEGRVTLHAFRNIGVQLLTVIVLAYGGLLDGAVLTETVFGWPGFGQYLTAGLLAGDMNVVLTGTLLVGLVFVTLNLVSDVLYRVLDPRTR